MKSAILVVICLVLGCQAGVLKQSKELQDIPVTIVQEPEALALSQPAPEQLKQQPAEPAKDERQVRTSLEQAEPVAAAVAVPAAPAVVEQPLEVAPAAPIKQAKIEPEPESEPELKLSELPAQPIKQQKIEPAEKQPEQPAPVAIATEQQQKLLPTEPEQKLNELISESIKQLPQAAAAAAPAEEAVQPQVRQATQATPVQPSSTQQNFVQQLLQNSPIGQFLNQFNPNNQQQTQQPQADQPTSPAPTVPGFLTPQAAITSAQQAVQNAAQTVQNATTQAFQGIQQFANNLGTQFQNTLSGLTGQQQQQASAEPTTPRPPGPIQSFVNNVFGGGANATAPAASTNPLQGIINFLGGNRPQNGNYAATSAAPATDKPAVDEKIDNLKPDEQPEQLLESDAANEVRSSAENADDSFEEAVPADEVIVVNDDSNDVVAPVAVESAPQPEKQAEPQPLVVQPAEISV